jgi:hypothetical protein
MKRKEDMRALIPEEPLNIQDDVSHYLSTYLLFIYFNFIAKFG